MNNCLCGLFDNNNSCSWIIILLIILFLCNGSNGYSNNCGCGC